MRTTASTPTTRAPGRRRARALAAAAAAALLAGACSGGGDDVDVEGGGSGGSGGGGGGGDGTFVAAISGRPDQLDPHKTSAYPSFQVLENVYDTLVVPDPEDLTYQPSLATEWTTSEDGLTWSFTLRDGVVFHDGSEFDAADVVYSYDRIVDEELQNAYRFATVEDVVAVDPRTVELRLSAPTPNLLDQIGNFKGMAILPEGAAEQVDLNQEAVGTGPYRLASVNPGDVQLTAFEDYWGDAPGVGEVEVRFVAEPTQALTALRTGEVQWTDNVPPQDITSLEDEDGVTLGRTPSVDYWYMAFNIAQEPWSDVRARQAMAYAVDREAVTQAARFDAATVNQAAIPEQSFWYYDYAPFEPDPDRARSLLQEAGVQDGQAMRLMVTDEFPETVQAAQVIAAQLGEVGVDVQVETVDFATWLDRQGRGDFDAFMLGWLGNNDPFGWYDSQHRCEGGNNYQGYCNPEVDRLLDEAATETDRDRRKELYDQAATTIVDEVSYLYFYNPDVVQAWSDDVTGYEVRADRAVNFETVELSQ
ncbi:ABC transporter substrate-binding protein [Vallicoccus soli]|uniref:ABC transporter substrate-binding protein n=1 Tax=Vallicoccus soli TaxID=2339232 RepID=A0A3A3Z1Z6_9ACTN|nr:ABC transporter substrate-binding protein [Vallicoccus soli]RJK98270.1 ABC transporter substrate-binding protein [Vallicoccus soli]